MEKNNSTWISSFRANNKPSTVQYLFPSSKISDSTDDRFNNGRPRSGNFERSRSGLTFTRVTADSTRIGRSQSHLQSTGRPALGIGINLINPGHTDTRNDSPATKSSKSKSHSESQATVADSRRDRPKKNCAEKPQQKRQRKNSNTTQILNFKSSFASANHSYKINRKETKRISRVKENTTNICLSSGGISVQKVKKEHFENNIESEKSEEDKNEQNEKVTSQSELHVATHETTQNQPVKQKNRKDKSNPPVLYIKPSSVSVQDRTLLADKSEFYNNEPITPTTETNEQGNVCGNIGLTPWKGQNCNSIFEIIAGSPSKSITNTNCSSNRRAEGSNSLNFTKSRNNTSNYYSQRKSIRSTISLENTNKAHCAEIAYFVTY